MPVITGYRYGFGKVRTKALCCFWLSNLTLLCDLAPRPKFFIITSPGNCLSEYFVGTGYFVLKTISCKGETGEFETVAAK
jgi:hypothetical protein